MFFENFLNFFCFYFSTYFLCGGFKNALFASDSVSETSDRRMRGFAEALNRAGKSFDFMPCENPKEIGHLACEKIASGGIRFIVFDK